MSNCTNCNAPLEDGSLFCPNCGTKFDAAQAPAPSEMIFCASCGQQTATESGVCQACGNSLFSAPQTENDTAIPAAAPTEAPAAAFPAAPAPAPAKKRKLPVMIVAAVLVIALVVAGIIINPFRSAKGNPHLAYVKDKNISFTYLNKIKPFELTEKLAEDNMSNSDYASLGSQLSYRVQYSENERYVLYPDRMSDDSEYATLYYKDLKSKDPAIKIDSDVNRYALSPDGKKILYTKGNEGNLYLHDLKEKEKIASDVANLYTDDKLEMILYKTDDALYRKNLAGKKDAEKIASDANLVAASKDFSDLYYLKDEALYRKSGSKDSEKIASDVSGFGEKFGSGELYYFKTNETEVALLDYVTDDMKESDAKITEPDIADYQTADPDYGYTTTDYDAYYDARDKYQDKVRRDNLRENLKKETVTLTSKSLHYYDGSKEISVADGIQDSYFASADSAKALVAYHKSVKGDVANVKLSEISGTSEIRSSIINAQNDSSALYVTCKNTETLIEQENAGSLKFNNSASKFYFIEFPSDDSDDDDDGALMEVSVSGNSASKPTRIDDDVNSYYFKAESDEFYYFKDSKDGKGDMYANKKLLASDVWISSVTSVAESSDLVYLTDYSAKNKYGTLNLLKSAKSEKLADDVSAFTVISNGSIAYLKDFSQDRYKGDLFLYKGSSKPVAVDTDVRCIIAPYGRSFGNNLY